MKHQILEELAKVQNAKKEFFQELFQEAPQELLDRCSIVTIKKDVRFVASRENVNKIWVLLSGTVKALEEYISGDVYIFTRFNAPEVFGEMEAVAEIPSFRASLIAETDCVFVTVPVSVYLQHLRNNSKVLYKRTQSMVKHVLDQERDNRIYLMLNGMDRLKLYFIQHYKLNKEKNICILASTRQQIADETGYSVKTVNRTIKKLEEENLLKIAGQKLLITEEQYLFMLKSIDEKVNY